ncbi:hypothetical protein [Alloacidobacterium dinghuense]|uniref:hypothetical protein n=1 Tax=Alloacidobacterium dinghuense TaxID=2763107 RepID=UPI002036826A|nr:hypothetical protein [Alloacidobacterium dinghuense]
MFGDVEGLEQESEGADLELGDLVVAPIDRESEVGVELPGEFGVSGGYECLEIGYGAWQHGVSLYVGSLGLRGQDMGGWWIPQGVAFVDVGARIRWRVGCPTRVVSDPLRSSTFADGPAAARYAVFDGGFISQG